MQLTVQPYHYSNQRFAIKKKNQSVGQNNYATNLISNNEISFGSEKFDYQAHYKENLEMQTGLFGKKKRAKAITDAAMRAFYEGQADKNEADRAALATMREELKTKSSEISSLGSQIQGLIKSIDDNKADKEEQKRLSEELRRTREDFTKAKAEFVAKSKQADNTNKFYEGQTRREANKGWTKVAGNEAIKERLDESFIRRLAAEKAGVKVLFPNGILFYGPKSTGKTRFARAFAEQSGCNFVPIEMMQDDDAIIKDLLLAAKESKKAYETSGDAKKRTIILLDECDAIASESEKDLNAAFHDTSKVAKLKNFLQRCAEDFKCTVFMTTNHPLRFSSEILADQRVPVKIFLGPPEAEDAAEIFKYYLNGETDQVIDYSELAAKTMEARKVNRAYSVARIKEICGGVVEKLGRGTTQKAIIDKIVGNSDITPEEMAKFAEEIERITRRVL